MVNGHSWPAAAITAAVIIAKWGQMTSLITLTNGDAAVIIGNRRCDHEFVIIAPVHFKTFNPFPVRCLPSPKRATCTLNKCHIHTHTFVFSFWPIRQKTCTRYRFIQSFSHSIMIITNLKFTCSVKKTQVRRNTSVLWLTCWKPSETINHNKVFYSA